MQLIKQFESVEEAELTSKNLENRGILTHVSSKRSHNLSRHRTGAIKVGLWSMLDYQYDDAVSFLNNKSHIITTSIPKEEIEQLKLHASTEFKKSMNKFLVYAFSGVLSLILLFYFLWLNK